MIVFEPRKTDSSIWRMCQNRVEARDGRSVIQGGGGLNLSSGCKAKGGLWTTGQQHEGGFMTAWIWRTKERGASESLQGQVFQLRGVDDGGDA